MDDLTHRLRCKYPCGTLIKGEPEFGWRDFSGPAPEGVVLPTPLMLEAAQEIERLRTRLNTAMSTLRQIAETPRNRGARQNANATVRFLEAMTPNDEAKPTPRSGGRP